MVLEMTNTNFGIIHVKGKNIVNDSIFSVVDFARDSESRFKYP